MDPITILGAASSAIGIASFGLQLAQVLTKYANETSSAAQNLEATVTNIRAASDSIEQINVFLKEESDRVVKHKQKPALLSTTGIRKIQATTDDCLKIFWRVEAWVLNKDDSPDLETKIALRLCEYKLEVQLNPEKHSQILNVNEALGKARKLRESRFARLIYPAGEHKLDRYSQDLHKLQVSLNSFFSILSLRAVQNLPTLSTNERLKAHMYDMARHGVQDALSANVDLHAEPSQGYSMSYTYDSGARDWERQYASNQFMIPPNQTQYIPVMNGRTPYPGASYTGIHWQQLPSNSVSNAELYPRTPHVQMAPLPTVPDGPWGSSRRKEPTRKDTDRSDNSSTIPENNVPSEDAAMDLARNYMTQFDAKVVHNNESTKVYPGYLTPIEKPEDVDNLSMVAQQTQTSSDEEELDENEKSRKYHKDKSRHQKRKERGRSKSRKSTPSEPLRGSGSGNRGILRTSLGHTSSVRHGFSPSDAHRISKPEIYSDKIDGDYTISDLRSELNIPAPLYTRTLEIKQPTPEVSLKPDLGDLPSKYDQSGLSGPIQDNSGDLIDFSDGSTVRQQSTNEVIASAECASRNTGHGASNVDLLSGMLDELKMEGLADAIELQTIPQKEIPRENPDDIAQLVATKLLAALPAMLTRPTQAASGPDLQEYRNVEDYLVFDEEPSKISDKMDSQVIENHQENDLDEKPQMAVSSMPSINLPPSPGSVSPTSVPQSLEFNDDNLMDLVKVGEEVNTDVSIRASPPPSFREDHVHSMPPPAPVSAAYDFTLLDSQSSTSSVSTSSKHRISIRNSLKKVFKRDDYSNLKDMDEIFPTGSFITTFSITGHNFQQIPTSNLRKSEIEKMLSQSHEQDWWRKFCFLDVEANNSLTQILKPQGSYRRILIDLQKVKKSHGRLWSRGETAYIAIIVNKPLVHLDVAPDSGLDFRSTPIQAIANNNGINIGTQSLGKLILEAMEDKDSKIYCAYTIHPRIREISYQPPDWVKAHITRQSFSKQHIVGRIVELNTGGTTVVAKYLELTMLQQQQIDIIVKSKNEVDGQDSWTLAQLEVSRGQTITPGNDGIQSITIYLIADIQTKKNDSAVLERSDYSTSFPSIPQSIEVDNATPSPRTLKPIDFMEMYRSPQPTHSEPSNLDSSRSESTLLNSPEPPTAKPDFPNIESSYNEQRPLNHYEALGIPTDATTAAITEAYLALYKTSHPILNPTDPSAGKRFVEITEAYETLGAMTQREAYDREHNINQPPPAPNPSPPPPRPSVTFAETDSQHESRLFKETNSPLGRYPPNTVRYRNPQTVTTTSESFETENNIGSGAESPRREARDQSPSRQTRSQYLRRFSQARSPLRRSPSPNRFSVYDNQRTRSPPSNTAIVARPSTKDVNWRERQKWGNQEYQEAQFGRNNLDWIRRYETGYPPIMPGPRPSFPLLSSQQLGHQPAIPLGRRPSYYPDHYDGRSFDPRALPGSDNTDDDIVQQLLLEWTPAGEEAEAAEKQSKKRDVDTSSDKDLEDAFITNPRNESQKVRPAKMQDKGKEPQQQPQDGVTEARPRVQFDLNNITETISDEGYYTPRGNDASSYRPSPGRDSINKPATSRRKDSSNNADAERITRGSDPRRSIRLPERESIEINDVVKDDSSRKATVEDYTGDSPAFEKPRRTSTL